MPATAVDFNPHSNTTGTWTSFRISLPKPNEISKQVAFHSLKGILCSNEVGKPPDLRQQQITIKLRRNLRSRKGWGCPLLSYLQHLKKIS